MSAPTSTGAQTASAAVPATIEAKPPAVAAAEPVQPPNTSTVLNRGSKKNYNPRSTFSGPVTKPAGLSTLLHAVSDTTFSEINHYQNTYKIPCFVQFFYVLGLMDNQMSHTKRFTDANPDWIFFVSHLYYSILTYYFTLKCQCVGAHISNEQILFLEFIENNFDIQNAKVAGPLVPFFQALAACAGPYKNYGNLVFGIPNNLIVTQARFFLANFRYNAHLPSLIFDLDQMMRYIQNFAPAAPAAAAPIVATMNLTDQFYFNIFNVGAANNAANRVNMKVPNARHEPQIPVHVVSGFLGSSNVWRSCLPFDPATNQSTYLAGNNANPLTLEQILGFRGFGATANTNFNWFQQVGRIMQPYADFFRDSVSLGAITTAGIGIAYIRTTPGVGAAASLTADVTVRDVRYMPAGTPRYSIPAFTFTVYCNHAEESLDSVAEQMGLLTQLDVDWTTLNGAAATIWPGPLRGNTVVGPIDQMIDERVTPWINVTVRIPNLISGYYHQPVAMKFE